MKSARQSYSGWQADRKVLKHKNSDTPYLVNSTVVQGAALLATNPADFTDEQRKEFQEAPNRFSKKVLPHLIPFGGVFWIDNQHVIMTVRELPDGWNANAMPAPVSLLSPIANPRHGSSRIVTLDADTGDIQDAPYSVGDVVCYGDGNIVIEVDSEADRSAGYFSGKYGEKLERIGPPHIGGAACSQLERTEKYFKFHLLPQHGSLTISREDFLPHPLGGTATLYLSDKNEKLVATMQVDSDARPLDLHYLEYLNQYVEERIFNERTRRSGMLLSPDGKFAYIDTDPFMSSLANEFSGTNSKGSGGFKVTKVGLFWFFSPTPRRWKQHGLYFRENGKMLRLDDEGVGTAAVSPNGCKLFYQSSSANPNAFRETSDLTRRKLVVMNLCDSKK